MSETNAEADPHEAAQKLLTAAVNSLDAGSARPGQQQMVNAIVDALTGHHHALIQAGTGTGKSLGYLAPALIAAKPVVISTATLALQSQLVDHDLPRISDAVSDIIGRTIVSVLIKGRHHYLCQARLSSDAQEPSLFDTDDTGSRWLAAASDQEQQALRIRAWAKKTQTGDRSELNPDVSHQIWKTFSVTSNECVGANRCPVSSDCFAEKARISARTADIVVTNHSLLAINAIAENPILPEYEMLVIDEAHDLADRVTSAASVELNSTVIHAAARRIAPYHSEAANQLLSISGTFQQALDALALSRLERLPAAIEECLVSLGSSCRIAASALRSAKVDKTELETASNMQRAKAAIDELNTIAIRLGLNDGKDVVWTQNDYSDNRTLMVAPLSVSDIISDNIFGSGTVVATSATMTAGGSFLAIANSFGLDKKPSAWKSLDVGSPFDYPKQGILYTAAHLPRPAGSGLSDAAQAELSALVRAASGRTLGLFSSRKAATQAAELLRKEYDFPVLLQGEDNVPNLVAKFRANPESCLLGVLSLWQGVDVPGPTCSLVVIDRIPFPRPDEPLLEARCKAADDAGGSGFAQVSVPIAATRLAQGVGRLIRAQTDRGVVAILDSRLHHSRSYGRFLQKSVPPLWYTTNREVTFSALQRLVASQQYS